MTISDNTRTAGPFLCNGVTQDFPFSYKVFSRSDVLVALTDTATDVETLLTLDADYTVTLNANQNANPGGTVRLKVAPPAGKTLASISAISYTQPLDLTNQGGFYPRAINDALDRIVIMIQQVGARVGLGLNVGSAALVALLMQLATPGGSAVIGYLASGIGAVVRKIQDKLRENDSVLDFGADPTGATDSTEAFQKLIAALVKRGGGVGRIPAGTYMVTNLNIDQEGVMLRGEASGFQYAKATSGVVLVPGPGAIYAVRLKGTRTGVVINAAEGSGLANLQLRCPVIGSVEYGLFVDSGGTDVDSVQIVGFQNGLVLADQANQNVFNKINILLCSKVGYAVTEHQGAWYMHPNVDGITAVSNTTWTMTNSAIRQNNFGMVLRSLVGASLDTVVIESNKQAGAYLYRSDVSSLRHLRWKDVWLENNYEDYTTGATTYSIDGINMLKVNGAPIAWTSAYQAGYQMVIDSQTHYGGGGDTMDFDMCKFNCAGEAQKSILILAGFKIDFNKPWFSGGDTPNLVRVTGDAHAVHWRNPLVGNNPYALVESLTNNGGANSGSHAMYIGSSTGFNPDTVGGLYAHLGHWAGPHHFPVLAANDPRRAHPEVLHDYKETNQFPAEWRTGGAGPFQINSQSCTETRVGREVLVMCKTIVTVTAAVGGGDAIYLNNGLSFAAAEAGYLVGMCRLEALAGATPPLNDGCSFVYMNTVATMLTVLPLTPNVMTVGHQYAIYLQAKYVLET